VPAWQVLLGDYGFFSSGIMARSCAPTTSMGCFALRQLLESGQAAQASFIHLGKR
jgi:hypothetical protein